MALAWGGAALAAGAHGESPAFAGFSPDEVARIAGHGPWPPAWTRDPGNRVSGNPAAMRLGYLLFIDPGLSESGRVSCATCHDPDRGFQDGRATGRGLATGVRNTPGLLDVRYQRWFGWDGAHDNLWSASLRPILDPAEMGGSRNRTAERIAASPEAACLYALAFGRPPRPAAPDFLVNVAKAVASWQETLVSPETPFDAFRDALADGDAVGAARYPEAARRGLRIFLGRGQCASCHAGPLFTNGEFSDIGIPFFIRPEGVDPGRQAGIRRLLENPHNLLGPDNDDATRANSVATRHVRPEHRNFGEFKVPSLRNLTLTAPYMHNGSLPSLRDVVRHYSELDPDRLHSDGERILKPLRLSDEESADLAAFLESLSAPASRYAASPPPPLSGCRPAAIR